MRDKVVGFSDVTNEGMLDTLFVHPEAGGRGVARARFNAVVRRACELDLPQIHIGRDRMRRIARRLPLVGVDDVDRAERFFVRHGSAAVFFGRMIPLFRSFISIPAGIERLPLVRFCLLTLAGSAIWNSIVIGAG